LLVSRRVIDWCQLNDISQLIIGNNLGWKQDINIGKKNNQQFTKIPQSHVFKHEFFLLESCPFPVPSEKDKSDSKPTFSGKRIKRGLYKTSSGKIINADTNGSMNITRKVIPNFMNGIEGLPFIPVVLGLWSKIANVVV